MVSWNKNIRNNNSIVNLKKKETFFCFVERKMTVSLTLFMENDDLIVY